MKQGELLHEQELETLLPNNRTIVSVTMETVHSCVLVMSHMTYWNNVKNNIILVIAMINNKIVAFLMLIVIILEIQPGGFLASVSLFIPPLLCYVD